jgi:hypothetical protein
VQFGDGNVQHNHFGDSRPQVLLEQRLTRVRDLDDPISVGVHPALLASEGDPVFPEYVQRDLAPVLGDLVGVSRFVVVIGESTAGKTRLASARPGSPRPARSGSTAPAGCCAR